MFDRIDAFVRDVTEIESEAGLAELLGQISREMGFTYFALTLGHAPPPLTAEAVWTCATATRPRSEPAPSEVLTPRRRQSALDQDRVAASEGKLLMEPAAVPPEVPPVSTPGFSRLRTIAQDPKAVAITHFLIPAAAPFEKVNGARRPMQFIDTLRYLAPDRGATNAGPLPAV